MSYNSCINNAHLFLLLTRQSNTQHWGITEMAARRNAVMSHALLTHFDLFMTLNHDFVDVDVDEVTACLSLSQTDQNFLQKMEPFFHEYDSKPVILVLNDIHRDNGDRRNTFFNNRCHELTMKNRHNSIRKL